jgi:hypothetical protein
MELTKETQMEIFDEDVIVLKDRQRCRRCKHTIVPGEHAVKEWIEMTAWDDDPVVPVLTDGEYLYAYWHKACADALRQEEAELLLIAHEESLRRMEEDERRKVEGLAPVPSHDHVDPELQRIMEMMYRAQQKRDAEEAAKRN